MPGSDAWLQGLIDSLVDLSSRDALTGLANRRSFELALAREIDRVARAGEPALLLALDIDHFKRVNDTWGHGAGDGVIKAVAGALLECVRPMDLVARTGSFFVAPDDLLLRLLALLNAGLLAGSIGVSIHRRTGRAVLQRVVNQVVQDALYQGGVAQHLDRLLNAFGTQIHARRIRPWQKAQHRFTG